MKSFATWTSGAIVTALSFGCVEATDGAGGAGGSGGSTSAYDVLYDTPQSASIDNSKVTGLWSLTRTDTEEGVPVQLIIRADIRADSMRFATRWIASMRR